MMVFPGVRIPMGIFPILGKHPYQNMNESGDLECLVLLPEKQLWESACLKIAFEVRRIGCLTGRCSQFYVVNICFRVYGGANDVFRW